MAYFAEMVDADLVKEDQCDLFAVAATPDAALDAVLQYKPAAVSGKWIPAGDTLHHLPAG